MHTKTSALKVTPETVAKLRDFAGTKGGFYCTKAQSADLAAACAEVLVILEVLEIEVAK